MRYALVFTNPETYDWDETDMVIIESDTNPLDMDLDVLAAALAKTNVHEISRESGECSGLTETEWKVRLGNNSWFIRNCDDVDCVIGKNSEKRLRLDYLQRKEQACGLDKDELWEMTELESEVEKGEL